MLLTLVPATVSAAGTYPTANAVCVDGGKSFALPEKLYFKNGDSAGSFTGSASDYNATILVDKINIHRNGNL